MALKKLNAALIACLVFLMVGCAALGSSREERLENVKLIAQQAIASGVDLASLNYPEQTKLGLQIVKEALDVAEAAVKGEEIPVTDLMVKIYEKVPDNTKAGLFARIVLRKVPILLTKFAQKANGKIDAGKALEVINFIRGALGAY